MPPEWARRPPRNVLGEIDLTHANDPAIAEDGQVTALDPAAQRSARATDSTCSFRDREQTLSHGCPSAVDMSELPSTRSRERGDSALAARPRVAYRSRCASVCSERRRRSGVEPPPTSKECEAQRPIRTRLLARAAQATSRASSEATAAATRARARAATSGSSSTPSARRPQASAATSVVPEPQNGSSTRPPGRESRSM